MIRVFVKSLEIIIKDIEKRTVRFWHSHLLICRDKIEIDKDMGIHILKFNFKSVNPHYLVLYFNMSRELLLYTLFSFENLYIPWYGGRWRIQDDIWEVGVLELRNCLPKSNKLIRYNFMILLTSFRCKDE